MSTELTRVTAALEALGDDATPEEIAELAHLYSLRDVVAAMFSITDGAGGGGGGSQPFALLGPFRINFDTANIGTQAKVFDLAAGDWVIKAWAMIVTSWNSNTGDLLQLGIGPSDWATGNWWTITTYYAQEAPLGDAQSGSESSNVAINVGDPSSGLRAGYTNEAGALVAHVASTDGPPTQGAADIYALVYTPA